MTKFRLDYVSEPMCSDEVVPILTLLLLDNVEEGKVPGFMDFSRVVQHKLGVDQQCTTYSYWDQCFFNEKKIIEEFGFGKKALP